MDTALAYHAVVHALEGRGGHSAAQRFALMVRHALSGHVPHVRYRLAATARRREGIVPSAIESAVNEWLDLDLNPASQAIRGAGSATAAVRAFNAYNASVNLAVRTSVDQPGGRPVRSLVAVVEDLEGCRIGSVAALDRLVSQAASAAGVRTITSVAHRLGLDSSVGAHAAEALEEAGWMPLSELARRLGCAPRTLQRRLREDGLSAEMLRSATRLVRATSRLAGGASLTGIAMEEGFADLPHMSRSFKAACGMSPSLLRQMLAGAAGSADGTR